eukprot:4185614-Amphidinium_carterae.1
MSASEGTKSLPKKCKGVQGEATKTTSVDTLRDKCRCGASALPQVSNIFQTGFVYITHCGIPDHKSMKSTSCRSSTE